MSLHTTAAARLLIDLSDRLIDSCTDSRCSTGRLVLGVCDEASGCGWGLEPHSGSLSRCTRDADGMSHLLYPAPPPLGFPRAEGVRLMTANLRSTSEGSVIEFEYDADRGVLGVTVDEKGKGRRYPRTHINHPRQRLVEGFPPGIALRPWAMLYLHAGDQVHLSGYVDHGRAAVC